MFKKKTKPGLLGGSSQHEDPISNNLLKTGLLYCSWDKEAAIIQCAYAALFPRTLVLYKNEEDFSENMERPLYYFDLESCLAVQQTDGFPNHFGFMLLVIPGGVTLFGCETEAECDRWISQINLAMDVDIKSRELLSLVAKFTAENEQSPENDLKPQDQQTILVEKKPGNIQEVKDGSIKADYAAVEGEMIQISYKSQPIYAQYNPEMKINENLIATARFEDKSNCDTSVSQYALDSQDTSESLLDGSQLPEPEIENTIISSDLTKEVQKETSYDSDTIRSSDYCNCIGSESGLDKISDILDQVHPLLFDDVRGFTQKNVNKRKMNRYSPVSTNLSTELRSGAASIYDEIKILNSMLTSQETACSLLFESCLCLKETIINAYRQLALHKEANKSEKSTVVLPNSDPPPMRRSFHLARNPVKVVSAECNTDVSRQQEGAELKLNHTNSLVDLNIPGIEYPKPGLLHSSEIFTSDSTLVASKSSTESLLYSNTLVESLPRPDIIAELTPLTTQKTFPSLPCAQCLRSTLNMILTTISLLPASKEVLVNLSNISLHMYQHVSKLVFSVRNRVPNLSNIEVARGLALLVRAALQREDMTDNELITNENSVDVMLALVFNATVEICGQILSLDAEELDEDAEVDNRVKADWYAQLPERVEAEWMLPGYLSICLVIHNLSLRVKNDVKRSTKGTPDHPDFLMNGETNSESVRQVLESLALRLIQTLNQFGEGHGKENAHYNEFDGSQKSLHQLHFFPTLVTVLRQLQDNDFSTTPFQVNHDAQRGINANKLFDSQFGSSDLNAERKKSNPEQNFKENMNSMPMNVIRRPTSGTTDGENMQLDGAGAVESSAEDLKHDDKQHRLDYMNLLSALRRQHEEEKREMWDRVQLNWRPCEYFDAYAKETELQLRNLHSQLNHILETTAPQKSINGENNNSVKCTNSVVACDLLQQSHFVLLNQVEQAYNVFSEMLRNIEKNQLRTNSALNTNLADSEGTEFYPGSVFSGKVAHALASLSAAATDLKARLYGNEYEGEEEDETELPSEEDSFSPSRRDTKGNHPAPPGFVLHLSSPYQRKVGLPGFESDESDI